MNYLIFLIIILSCGNIYAQQPPPPVEGQPEVAENTAQSPEIKEDFELFLEPYNYEPSGRRDPFLKLDFSIIRPLAGPGGQQRPLLPLENFELETIRLIGIIWDADNPRGMFLDPTNKVHILTKDQRIGRNQGYIAVIRESQIVVVETSEKNGEPVYTTKVLNLSK